MHATHSIDDKDAKECNSNVVNNMDEIFRDKLKESVRKFLSSRNDRLSSSNKHQQANSSHGYHSALHTAQ